MKAIARERDIKEEVTLIKELVVIRRGRDRKGIQIFVGRKGGLGNEFNTAAEIRRQLFLFFFLMKIEENK